jgi:hypothetical protein
MAAFWLVPALSQEEGATAGCAFTVDINFFDLIKHVTFEKLFESHHLRTRSEVILLRSFA